MAKTALDTVCEGLKEYKRFLLTCHVSPEGDAIGSLIAMDSLLRRLGKKTVMISEDAFPKRLHCLPHQDRWKTLAQMKKEQNGDFEAAVITDCPTLERIGKVKQLITPQTVIFNIDHHISNTHFGRYNLVRPEAAASGEVVYEVFKRLNMSLTKEEAVSLYVALSTDTGSFKYSNTTVKAHLMAADLIKTGIDVDRINEELYATYSLNKIQLYSRLLAKVETTCGGKVAWVSLNRSDLKATGSTYEDTEGFIDFLKYLQDVKIAFVVSEIKENEARVSFRSKGDYDVNKIATAFGGGGHKKASGCTILKKIPEAASLILKEIKKQTSFK